MTQPDSGSVAIYTVSPYKGIPPLFFLPIVFNWHKPIEANLWNMFQGVSGEASLDFLRVVSRPAEADFLLFPHKYSSLKKIPKRDANMLISHFVKLAETHKKKILIFALADSDKHIDIPHSIIFRYSQYGYKKRNNEIMMPPYTAHIRSPKLSDYRRRAWKRITVREKYSMPTVSFCGWAGFSNPYDWLVYGFSLFIANVKAYIFLNQHALLHKPGIYFRRKSVQALKESTALHANFIMRKSFSAQIGFDGRRRINPEVAEKEHVESITNSDFILSAKGNANEAMRFYEALSLGRFPVLINTDKVLPLEDYIDYTKIVVTVDYARIIEDTEQAILDFYNSLTNEEFQKRQQMAREAFELLRPGSFLKIVLTELKKSDERYNN